MGSDDVHVRQLFLGKVIVFKYKVDWYHTSRKISQYGGLLFKIQIIKNHRKSKHYHKIHPGN